MRVEEIRQGMKVVVKTDLHDTDYLWTTSSEMYSMAKSGKPYIVDAVREMTPQHASHQEWVIEVNGFYFSPKDLQIYEEEGELEVCMETIKSVKFDPKSL